MAYRKLPIWLKAIAILGPVLTVLAVIGFSHALVERTKPTIRALVLGVLGKSEAPPSPGGVRNKPTLNLDAPFFDEVAQDMQREEIEKLTAEKARLARVLERMRDHPKHLQQLEQLRADIELLRAQIAEENAKPALADR